MNKDIPTPRNDELLNRTAGWRNSDHLVELDKLSRDLERDNAQLRKALKNVTIMVDIGAVVSTDPELDPQIKKTMEAARTALGEGRKPVARSGQTNPATGKSDAAQGQPEGQG